MKHLKITWVLIFMAILLTGCAETEITPQSVQPEEHKNPQTEQNTQAGPISDHTPATHRIEMTSSGFIPAEITVRKNDTVNFVNTDAKAHWPASASHPTHKLLPSFDSLTEITSGSTYAHTFDKTGVFPFHDHLQSLLRGEITVTE